MSAAVVYRMYDADCRLLYVGQSASAMQRFLGHQSATPWWDDVDTISVEHFDSREDALLAEATAIQSEAPLHNVQHSKRVRRPRERDDESTWPTTDLRLNPAALEWLLNLRRRSTTELNYVTPHRLAEMLSGAPVDLAEAQLIATDLGVSVATLFPNRDPSFGWVEGVGFVDARRAAA